MISVVAVRLITPILIVVAGGLTGAGVVSAADGLPPVGGAPDYQLGATYAPPAPVTIVGRDRTARPAPNTYSICYVNAFQTQPGEQQAWPADVLLRDAQGDPVHDPDWPDEILLDTRTSAQRDAIVQRVGSWISGCADSGFNAVEFDNLDSYSRSGAVLRRADAVAVAHDLVTAAHRAGLSAAQKNAGGDAAEFRRAAGFDFAVAEECAAYDECGSYTAVYGAQVIDVEYTDNLPRPFGDMCADPATPRSVVLRDRGLVAPSSPNYRFELCS